MNFRGLAPALFAAVLLSLPVLLYGADHRESPDVIADPAADINDLYAFMNPNDSNELVLVLTVFPDAPAGALFSDALRYRFLLANNAPSPDEFIIDCTFNAPDEGVPQSFECAGPAGITVGGDVDTIVSTDPDMRVFAGLRDDPFFFDGPGFVASVNSNSDQFTGANSFAGENILTVVVGINRSLLTRSNEFPVLKIWSSTERI